MASDVPSPVKKSKSHKNIIAVRLFPQEGSKSAIRGRVVQLVDQLIKAGATQEEIAEALGTGQGTISGWKRGRVPDAQSLARIAKVYERSGHWLLTGEPPIEPPGVRPDLQAAYDAGWAASREAALRAVALATVAEDAARRGASPPGTGRETAG